MFLLLRMQKCLGRLMLLNSRSRLIFLALLVISLLGLLFNNYHGRADPRYCFMEQQQQQPPHHQTPTANAANNDGGGGNIFGPQLLDDVLLTSDVKPTPGRSIFFHETSCRQPPWSMVNSVFGFGKRQTARTTTLNLVQLNARQACAIESAALNNPHFSVFVLFSSPAYIDNNATENTLLDAILSYPNVHLRNLNMWTYAAYTPIYDWLKDGELFKSSYLTAHVSDFLRYVTLWRFGGIYLDLDIINQRSLEDLPPNYTGAESFTHLAAGVMNFAATGFGHEIAEQCLHEFQRNFDGSQWGLNGPGVITRVMQSVCGTKNIALMMDRKRCMGFNVFSREAFYAIPWVEWDRFFEAQYLDETLARTRDSYIVHVWNKHSKERRVKVGSNVAYGKLAAQHCPKVYGSAGEYF